ncbi:glutathione S-transferase family protein [Paracraurococcus ruber]|nr:glutathione S-transferase family protein [Paracraurococcus ruber]
MILVSHHLCPYVQRAAIALAEKGASFERVTISLDAKPDWFTALSPLGKVPLLRVPRADGTEAVLFESAAICEFIEDTVPGPRLHPEDPVDRARHRAWMEFGSVMLGDIWGLETTQDPAVFEQKRQAVAAKAARLEEALESASPGGPFFAGPRFSLVDAVFGPVFRYFDVFDGIADTGVFAGLKRLQAWRLALTARPSVRGAVAPDYADRLRAFLDWHDAHLLRWRPA